MTDLTASDVPTPIIHGDDDLAVPIGDSDHIAGIPVIGDATLEPERT